MSDKATDEAVKANMAKLRAWMFHQGSIRIKKDDPIWGRMLTLSWETEDYAQPEIPENKSCNSCRYLEIHGPYDFICTFHSIDLSSRILQSNLVCGEWEKKAMD